jgi:hypothetical protein
VGAPVEDCDNLLDDDNDGLTDCDDSDCYTEGICLGQGDDDDASGGNDPCCIHSSGLEVGNCHDIAAAQSMCSSGLYNQCCVGMAMWDSVCVAGYHQYGANCP